MRSWNQCNAGEFISGLHSRRGVAGDSLTGSGCGWLEGRAGMGAGALEGEFVAMEVGVFPKPRPLL